MSFSGQVRPRFISDSDSVDANDSAKQFDTRIRLNAKANINANTSAFLQFQSVGVWGTTPDYEAGTRISQGGGTGAGAAAQASDELSDVGFHQAFVTFKNFFNTGLTTKIGRQEVVLDGHRLFGHTGWTTGGETKDAIRLTHAAGNHAINAIYIAGRNSDSVANSNEQNEDMYVLHGNTQGVMGGNLSAYFVMTEDGTATTGADDKMTWYTIGARQAGKLGGIDYRVEYYHQFGEAGAAANALSGYGTTVNNSTDIDRSADMFGIRIGKTFKNAQAKPTITFWYDRLSGTDDDDVTGTEYGTFDTLSDTGHKFYGFQDFYLNAANQGTRGLGLEDFAIKTKMSPKPGWTLKADMHWFNTAVDASGGDANTYVASDAILNGQVERDLGSELDLVLIHKYDANTKLVMGYSHYWTSNTFSMMNTGGASDVNAGATSSTGNDDSDWMFVMLDTKF
ncbi:alginate export family protein [Nitrospinaceae bacterium]|nr:alginate export family protein [Nitrospinaceae bacterium]